MYLAYWVHHWSPFLIRFSDNFGIRYYGLAYMLGFLAAAWLFQAYYRAGRSSLAPARIGDLMMAIVLGVLIGGRLGYFILYDAGALLNNPLVLFRVWEGGMASHGGMIGVVAALFIFARQNRLDFFHLGDLVVSATPVGLLLGRIANFINGELWGKIAFVPWAVIFPHSAPEGTPLAQIAPRHPSQLYEAGLEGVLLLAYLQWRFWKSDVVRTHPGRLAGEFFLGYAVVRMIGEIFREPDAGVSPILGLSRGTFYSVFLIIAGLALVLRRPGRPA